MSKCNEVVTGSTSVVPCRLCRFLLLLGASVLLACIVSLVHPQREALRGGQISALTLADALKLKPIWIDARAREDFEHGHIPGAVSLDAQHWEEGFSRLAAVIHSNTILVVYCSNQGCHSSQETAIRLKRELGSQAVYTLKGGFEAWQSYTNKP